MKITEEIRIVSSLQVLRLSGITVMYTDAHLLFAELPFVHDRASGNLEFAHVSLSCESLALEVVWKMLFSSCLCSVPVLK